MRDEFSVGVGWRYLDEMDVFDVIGFDNVNTEADAQNYFDLSAAYEMDNWRISGGIQNLTDEEPPYVPDVSANTSGIYDYLGRTFYARVSMSFE